MRKYFSFFLIFIILFCPVYSYSAKVTVSDLYPAYKVYDVVNKSWSVPAKVRATAGAVSAVDSVALGLTKAIAGGVVTTLAVWGVSYLANEAIDYLLASAAEPVLHTKIGSDLFYKFELNGASLCTLPFRYIGHYPNGDAAFDACLAASGEQCAYPLQCIFNFVHCGSGEATIRIGGLAGNGGVYATYGGNPEVTEVPAVYPDIFSKVNAVNGLTDSESEAVAKAIDEAGTAYGNPAIPGVKSLAGNPAAANAVKDVVDTAIPLDVAANLTDKVAGPNAIGANASAGDEVARGDAVTPNVISKAISDALSFFFGTDVTPPVDPTITSPDKKDLTSIMTGFFSNINSLPIVSTLRGLTLNASGSCNLCVNLPTAYGGTRCYSACAAQDSFNLIGTTLLSITTLLSFIYLFKG